MSMFKHIIRSTDKMITTGVWRVYPNLGVAINIHNGNTAYMQRARDIISVLGINIPAKWTMEELINWAKDNAFVNA